MIKLINKKNLSYGNNIQNFEIISKINEQKLLFILNATQYL